MKEIEELYIFLKGIARGPEGIFSVWPDGMPRSGGDPETALLQREDINEAIDRLEELMKNTERRKTA